MRRLLSVASGMILALCFFGLAIELTDTSDYRLLHTDPVSGMLIYTKHSSYIASTECFDNTVTINNIGFHGPDVPPQKEKDVFRIVVLGSSFVEARQVSVAQMYSTLLQDKLNAQPNRKYTYEVIPLGVDANGLFLSTLYYQWYGSPLKPDLVINFETQYEVDDFGAPPRDAQGSVLLQVPKPRENATKAYVRDQLRRSKLLVNLYNRYVVFHDDVSAFLTHPFFFLPQHSATQSAAALAAQRAAQWQSQADLLSALAQLVRHDHAKMLQASWYINALRLPQVSSSTMQDYATHYHSVAAGVGLPYIDVTPAMSAEEAASGNPAIWPCDVHWTPEGNRYMADALYQYLVENPDLISR